MRSIGHVGRTDGEALHDTWDALREFEYGVQRQRRDVFELNQKIHNAFRVHIFPFFLSFSLSFPFFFF